MTWHLFSERQPRPGERMLFGCEGFMACVDQELRPVRFDGDRAFFGGIITMPKWWAELPKVPEEGER